MADLMTSVQGLLERLILKQKEKDIRVKECIHQRPLLLKLPMVTYQYANESKQPDFKTKSDIFDADDELKVRSVQMNEDLTELESGEEADSALQGEESCKQIDNEDALLYILITARR
uniref:Uncharacterized protein n=1 Tax=Romanomermis culicivorax TaxID=13658 RepID=A0A915IQL7_ROMCU